MKEFTLTLEKKTQLTSNVYELRFTRPEDFTFLPGQFVQFLVQNGEKTVPRSYSISSTTADPYLEFCVKILPEGLASTLFLRMQVGETAKIRGPLGHFTYNGSHPGYFIATGVGLAPIMGMLQEQKDAPFERALLFGVRDEDDVFWENRLKAITSELFTFDITLSKPKPTGGWKGLKGRVTEHILHHLVDHHFYLCGSAAMVKDVRTLLLEHGIEKSHIHFEIF